jgi:ABC-type transport system substrate-binding protein
LYLQKQKAEDSMAVHFRYNEEEYLKSLYPLNVTEVTAHRIAEQIYEGLVKFDDSTLAVLPCLAKSWDISADGIEIHISP